MLSNNETKEYKQTDSSQIIDGSKFYNPQDKSINCKIVECPDIYKSFKGTWTGTFQSYDQKIKAFRPFKNKVIYDGRCYKNIKNGEIFVVGIKIDIYPEYMGLPSKTDTSMLITGMTGESDPKPFLRTIDKEDGLIEYQKVFEDKSSEMSIWEYDVEKKDNQPEMRFRIIDFRNLSNETKVERFVSISMRIGTQDNPYWEGLIVKGSHTRNNK
jgi:hypothetical protein